MSEEINNVYHIGPDACILDRAVVDQVIVYVPDHPYTRCAVCGSDVYDPSVFGVVGEHVLINGTQYDQINRVNPIQCPSCGDTKYTNVWTCGKSEVSLADILFSRVKLNGSDDDGN